MYILKGYISNHNINGITKSLIYHLMVCVIQLWVEYVQYQKIHCSQPDTTSGLCSVNQDLGMHIQAKHQFLSIEWG